MKDFSNKVFLKNTSNWQAFKLLWNFFFHRVVLVYRMHKLQAIKHLWPNNKTQQRKKYFENHLHQYIYLYILTNNCLNSWLSTVINWWPTKQNNIKFGELYTAKIGYKCWLNLLVITELRYTWNWLIVVLAIVRLGLKMCSL